MTARARFATLLALPLLCASVVQADTPRAFEVLISLSHKEGIGLIFYVNGHAIPGVVINPPHDGVVEVRNQQHDSILIRLDHVDAIAGR